MSARLSLTLAVFAIALRAAPPPLAAQDAPERRAAPAPLAPLAWLVGSCWRGTFPDGGATDEHCFEWVFERKFVRDRHLVLGQRDGPYRGETWYAWDPASGAIVFHYYNSLGDLTRGTVQVTGQGLTFPETLVTARGVQVLRTTWWREGDHRYASAAEAQTDGGWRRLWSMPMTRQAAWNDAVAPRPGSSRDP